MIELNRSADYFNILYPMMSKAADRQTKTSMTVTIVFIVFVEYSIYTKSRKEKLNGEFMNKWS